MFSASRSFFLAAALGGAILAVAGYVFFQGRTLQLDGRELSWMSQPEAEKQEPVAQSSTALVLFGGDMQLDRYIRSVTEQRGGAFIFDGLRSEFRKVDLVVANLEGPITENPSVSVASREGAHDNYVFTFPIGTAALLRQENVRLVNIGNNHILNFKEDGVKQTKEFLSRSGVDFFGSPLAGDDRTSIQTLSGIRIGFVNYNEFIWKGREKASEDIAAMKALADFTVVYAHWGEEYVEATPEMKVLAREFIDAGADLIIGSHPHVVQAQEEYHGKRIYYSLGNLIFDQYFRPETASGLLVRAEFDREDKSIIFTDLPIRLKTSGQTELAPR